MIGKKVLHYEILEKLGEGGMGVVYKAHDTKLDRDVAIKVLHPSLTSGEDDRQRFIVEAKAAAALNHSHIATIHAIEEFDSQLFIVMEYIQGRELIELCAKSELIPTDRAFDFSRQIANGLNAAHNKGIIHRDIKSSNIMITDDGRIKIMDFGLAKFADAKDSTKEQTTLGTIAYMAPEQIKGQPATRQSDIFSFGVVLYELLTGALPFDSEYEAAILYSIMNEEPQPVKSLRPECPSALSDIVSKCLEKETDNRFKAMGEIVEALKDGSFKVEKSILSTKHNLPVQLTSFIGRDKEIKTVQKLLLENRLVTLTGTGGCGKSRLSQEAARGIVSNYSDGVWFMELAAIAEGSQVDGAIASAFQIKEQAGKTELDILELYLADKQLMLILDNCEHLIEACSKTVETLLKAAANIDILTTSREALNIPGEKVWRVPSLSLPSDEIVDNHNFLTFEAVQLFVDRAQQSVAAFELHERNAKTVADICTRLDGIPLAIELAASRIRLFQPEMILNRLDDRFRILTGGSRTSLERHQTLRATIDWSHDLLNENEKVLFRRLAVFRGGFEMDAVEKVCDAAPLDKFEIIDLFTALVDKSLLVTLLQKQGTNRYRLLETIRHYANQKLSEAGEAEQIKRNHFDYYLNQAETAFLEQIEKNQFWGDHFLLELENFKAALDWIDSDMERLQLAGALGWFWYDRTLLTTGLHYLQGSDQYEPDSSFHIARAIMYFGYLKAFQGNLNAFAVIENAFKYLHSLYDRIEGAYIYAEYAILQCFMGDFNAAFETVLEAQKIGEKLNNKALILRSKTYEAQTHIFQFDVERAEPLVEQNLNKATELNLPREKALNLHLHSDCAILRKQYKVAEKRYGITLTRMAEIGNRMAVLIEMTGMAFAIGGQKRYLKAVRLKGFIDKAYAEFGTVIPPAKFWQDWVKEYIGNAIKSLGEEKAQQALQEGREMNFEQSVEYALDFDKD